MADEDVKDEKGKKRNSIWNEKNDVDVTKEVRNQIELCYTYVYYFKGGQTFLIKGLTRIIIYFLSPNSLLFFCFN